MASRTHQASDWRELIGVAVTAVWPGLLDGPLWIEAQVNKESAGDPQAVGSAGEQGLLQLMPATATELGVANPFDPAENLWGGITYLRRQFDRLEEVPEELERLLWSFAAFNCGLGYVWKALCSVLMIREGGSCPLSKGGCIETRASRPAPTDLSTGS